MSRPSRASTSVRALFTLAITTAIGTGGCTSAHGSDPTDANVAAADGSDQAPIDAMQDDAGGDQVTGMSVSGNQLRKDGVRFMARGFNMVGALTPQWCGANAGVQARQHFDSAELTTQLTTWHANTIRLQVSQRGLEDPTLTSAQITAYVQQLQDDVTLARGLGLVVILSMQDQSIGCGAVHPLPSSQTVAAWQRLAPAFAASPYVMFELFNEPQNGDTSADWAQWRNGGNAPLANLGDAPVGFQTLVTAIRTTGAKNVLIADGALHAEHLDNITPYLLTETTGRGIAYTIHPYYYAPGAAYWQNSWGFLTTTRAVIATEWNFKANDCGTNVETLTPSFLTWLHTNGIGLTAHAFDYPGTLVTDFSFTPTACGTASGGAGQVLKTWYAHLALTEP